MPPSIRPDRSLNRRIAGLVVAIAILAGVGVGVGMRWHDVDAPRVMPIAASASAPAVVHEAAPSPEPVAATPPAPPQHRPATLTPHEWAGVQAQSAAASQPEQEAARMAGYVAFQKSYLEWRALARGGDPARRDALGQQLLDGLPAQVQQGDVALQQARSVQEEVLAARIPDAAQRAPILAQEQQRLPADTPPMAPPQQAFH